MDESEKRIERAKERESSHHIYVKNVLNHYKENDIVPGDPNEGEWHQAHYPCPKHLGGTQVILLLREHHAVQGVLQSEEFQSCCVWGWEAKYLTGHLLDLFHKWRFMAQSKGGKTSGRNAKTQKYGRFNKSDPRIIEGALRGARAPAGRKLKQQWIQRRAMPILITRESDGHVFYFDSFRQAEDILKLDRKGLSRNLDKDTTFKGHKVTTFQ